MPSLLHHARHRGGIADVRHDAGDLAAVRLDLAHDGVDVLAVSVAVDDDVRALSRHHAGDRPPDVLS